MRLILQAFLALSLLVAGPAWAEKSRIFEAIEVRQALHVYLQINAEMNKGTFTFDDPDYETRKIRLEFVDYHKPIKRLGDGGYFACADFRVAGGEQDQLYDLDFWLYPNKDGILIVRETKIHQDPVLVSGKWMRKSRYSFIN